MCGPSMSFVMDPWSTALRRLNEVADLVGSVSSHRVHEFIEPNTAGDDRSLA